MTKEGKKKKSLFRRIIKWFSILLFLLIVAIILIPILFKDQIKEMVIDEVNTTLNAKLELDDFDLTFLSTFPKVTARLDGVRLKGVNEFENVELANIKQFVARVNLWDVIGGDQISVNEIHVYEPKIDVRVLQNGMANYDIVKPDSVKTEEEISEPSNFKFSLQEYSINNGLVRYNDDAGNLFAELTNLNHTGKGDLTADIIDFETTTTMDELTFDMDGMSYLAKVKTDAVANIKMEFTEKSSKFTLQENSFQLNAVKFDIDGFYEMLSDHDEMDMHLNADKVTFKELLSLIPAFYHSGYENMIANGSIEMKADVKGKLDDSNLPSWDAGLKVSNASIKYPDLPGKINNIAVVANSKFPGGSNMDAMTIDVDKFHADFVGNTLDATLKMRNPETNPWIKSGIQAKVDLATLSQVVPMEGEEYSGKLDADVNLDGYLNDLDKGNYEAFKAEGTLGLTDMNYKSAGLNESVSIQEMLFRFAPQYLALEKMNAKTGRSDFQMDGKIENYIGYIFREEPLKGNFNFNSTNLDLDQLMNLAPTDGTSESAEETTTSEETEPILIPANIDFDMATRIGNVVYNSLNIKNVAGRVTLKDQIATLHNLDMDAMGGHIGLTGNYNTQDHSKPKANFGYQLKELDIKELATNFVTVEKLAPIAKYATGKISSNFNMSTDLTPGLEPILSSLNGLGDLTSNSITISGFKPMEKMSEVTMLSNLKSQTINDVKARFKFSDGRMSINPFDIKLAGMKTNVAGSTGLDQSIDYAIKMLVPKDKIPGNMVKATEDAAAKLSSLSPKLNVSALPAELPINIKMLGSVTDPKVSTNFKEALMEASGNMKDALINNVKETVKDTAKAIVNEQINNVKEDVEAKKQKILADAQKQADKVVAEAKKSADAIRAEADKQYQAAIDAAGSNPVKKKAAEIAAKPVKDQAYKKAGQVEAEGQKQADAIMAKARAEADKL